MKIDTRQVLMHRCRSGPVGWRAGRCALMVSLVLISWCVGVPVLGQNPRLLQESLEAFYGGELLKARPLLEGYLRVNPADSKARILLARVLAGLGENDRSFEQLKAVLEEDPANIDALFYMGSLAAALSHVEFGNLFRLAPDSARVHQLMGESFQARRKFGDAEREFEAALKVDPDLTEAIVALGDLKRTQGEFEPAIEFYERVLTVDPREYRALYGIGVCHRYLQQTSLAAEFFGRALQIAPDYSPAHLGLGTVLVQEGKLSAAVESLLTAISLEPEMDQAYFQLGRAYQALGDGEKARWAFTRAQELKSQQWLRSR